METRPLGNTGFHVPILSFGGENIVDSHGCTEKEAVRILNTAIDRGIHYFDTAWIYSAGQSETRIGLVAKHRRAEMFIASKVWDRTRDGARRQLETSLHRLQTDHLDLWQMHAVNTWEDLDTLMGKGGALETAIRAREEGLIRFIGITGHHRPQIQAVALNRFPFDTVLVPLSVLDSFIHSFEAELLPVALEKNVGVIGMKVLATGELRNRVNRCIRYSLGLPISTAVIGMETIEQLEENLDVAENFQPLSQEEKLELYKETIAQALPSVMWWKSEGQKGSAWGPDEPAQTM